MGENLYIFAVIAIMAAVTYLTRALPFLLLEKGGKTPKVVEYLGKVLPPALMTFLLIYCVRNADWTGKSHGLPELIGVATAMLLHWWKRNTFISILVSTVVYMGLIHLL